MLTTVLILSSPMWYWLGKWNLRGNVGTWRLVEELRVLESSTWESIELKERSCLAFKLMKHGNGDDVRWLYAIYSKRWTGFQRRTCNCLPSWRFHICLSFLNQSFSFLCFFSCVGFLGSSDQAQTTFFETNIKETHVTQFEHHKPSLYPQPQGY